MNRSHSRRLVSIGALMTATIATSCGNDVSNELTSEASGGNSVTDTTSGGASGTRGSQSTSGNAWSGGATTGGALNSGGTEALGGMTTSSAQSTPGGATPVGGAVTSDTTTATGGSFATTWNSVAGGTTGIGGSTPIGGTTTTNGTTAVGGTAASGGTAMTSTAAATAGGQSGAGATINVAGAADTAGTGGTVSATAGASAVTAATGVAVLTVPLDAVGQGQRFNYQNTGTSAPYDLSGASLEILAYAPEATGGNLHVFFRSTNNIESPATDISLSTLTAGFVTVSVPVPPAASSGFDPTNIFVTRIEVESGTSFGTSWQTPATIVYVDAISTSNGCFNDDFSTNPTNAVFGHSGARALTGATFTWVSTYP